MHLSLGTHGCGASHSREVTRGVPAKTFSITCPPCEAYLRGDRKQKILKYQTDKRPGRQSGRNASPTRTQCGARPRTRSR